MGPSAIRVLWAAWGVGGTIATLVEAIVRLTPIALAAFEAPQFSTVHLVVLLGWVAFNTYFEGYRGFHRAFAPRSVATAVAVARHGTIAAKLLAPLVCLGLVFVPRRRLIVSWALVGGIVTLVVCVRHLAQPWRGIVDAGVVSALSVGLLSIGWHVTAAVAGRLPVTDELIGTTGPNPVVPPATHPVP